MAGRESPFPNATQEEPLLRDFSVLTKHLLEVGCETQESGGCFICRILQKDKPGHSFFIQIPKHPEHPGEPFLFDPDTTTIKAAGGLQSFERHYREKPPLAGNVVGWRINEAAGAIQIIANLKRPYHVYRWRLTIGKDGEVKFPPV